uniref:Uncharacterized protein n=1 Tax=Brassica campestris TaxID=3711 RepID=M4DV99_BRACM
MLNRNLVVAGSWPASLSRASCLRYVSGGTPTCPSGNDLPLGEVGDVSAQKHVRVPPEFGALHV